MSHISFYMKSLGQRSAGKPHAALDVAGAGDGPVWLRASSRPYCRAATGNGMGSWLFANLLPRQLSTLLKSPNPSASPFPVANSTQSEIQSVFRSFVEFATGKGFGERIRRFMNSPG